ncbi:MAG TPA: hypothetical protein VHV77_14010 [Pirellulales bacterium]|jgi:hypothetical protein|nr:hypothetical protein [Pirellulales bacterium]
MKVAPTSDEVRTIVERTLSELTGSIVEPDLLRESVLINDGKYRGRTYRDGEFTAMWFVDIGLVQFYDGQGNLVRTIKLFEEQMAARRAA